MQLPVLESNNMSWFSEMCLEMEAEHGERGWKRRLAETLGVSDSNVQNWIRAGDAPPIVRTAFEAKARVRELERELSEYADDNYVIEQCRDQARFRVLKNNEASGHFVEVACTHSLALARAIIQVDSGNLDRKISELWDLTYDHLDQPTDRSVLNDVANWQIPSRRERAAELKKLLTGTIEHFNTKENYRD